MTDRPPLSTLFMLGSIWRAIEHEHVLGVLDRLAQPLVGQPVEAVLREDGLMFVRLPGWHWIGMLEPSAEANPTGRHALYDIETEDERWVLT